MKSSLRLFVAIAAVAPLHALAVPSGISFSARIADNGRPVNGSHAFVFKLWNGPDPATATALWEESESLVVADGVVADPLGNTTAIPAAVFDGSALWLEVTLDGTAFPTVAIQSVPYSLRAAAADLADLATHATTADSVPFAGVTGKVGNLVDVLNANANGVTNNITGFFPMLTYTPSVNVRANVTVRCTFDGTVGQVLAFRAGNRTPPGVGPGSAGAALEQADTITVVNSWVSNNAVDSFLLNAGVSYELGPFFIRPSPPGGAQNDFCSVNVQAYQR